MKKIEEIINIEISKHFPKGSSILLEAIKYKTGLKLPKLFFQS